MKPVVVVLLFLSVSFIGCEQNAKQQNAASGEDSTYILTGNIEGLDSGWVYLFHRQSAAKRTDSVRVKDGVFVFSGRADTPEFCNLGTLEQGNKKFHFGFFLQNGKLALRAKKDSLTDAAVQISGAPVEEEFKGFLTSAKEMDDKSKELETAYVAAAKAGNNKKLTDSLNKAFEELDSKEKKLAGDYAAVHPDSYVAAFEIYSNFFYNPDVGQLDSIYSKLDGRIQRSYFGKKIKTALDFAKKTAIGNLAPDFVQNDVAGKPVSLSSFKGKYVLVDFWASWCGPCRLEDPNVVAAYREYHPKGFDILGVSLDVKKDKWIAAIKKDKLDWTQVSDLSGWNNSVAQLYGVQGIPMNYLIDKQGRIVGKGLEGEDLEKKLAETVK